MMDSMRSPPVALGVLVAAARRRLWLGRPRPRRPGRWPPSPSGLAVTPTPSGWLALAVASPVGHAEARRPPRRPGARVAAARRGRRRDADEAERRAGVVGRRVGRPGDQATPRSRSATAPATSGSAYAGDPKGTFNTFALRIPGASSSNLLTSFAQMTPRGDARRQGRVSEPRRPRRSSTSSTRRARSATSGSTRSATRCTASRRGRATRGDEAARAAPQK